MVGKIQPKTPAPEPEKKPQKPSSLRAKVGWIAIGMAALVGFGVYQYYRTGEVGLFELNRTCVMMLLLWLAWPELETLPRWLFLTIPVVVAVCAWRPQFLLVALPATLFYWWLRPPRLRKKK